METNLYYFYILTNKHHPVFYTGVTNNLGRRCNEHKKKLIKGFTAKYNLEKLVYYEVMLSSAKSKSKDIQELKRRNL